MPSTITAEKAALRRSVKEIHLTREEQRASDRLLFQRFLSLPQLTDHPSIFLYYGVGAEPDTVQLLEPLALMGKALFLPCCLPGRQMEARQYRGEGHLIPGPFGIPQPDTECPAVNPKDLSLILLPGLCFDVHGFRLGHGGGYYDRYLAGSDGFTVALCRDKLLFPALPVEKHDRPVDLILTESRSLSPF